MVRKAAAAIPVSLAMLLAAMVAAHAEAEKIVTMTNSSYGTYLSDDDGHAAYLFTKDGKAMSACHDSCAKAWPPMMTTGAPIAGPGVKANLLGTIPRDGGMQVTYAGMPLYYFSGDRKAASTAGQGITHFGGSWYLVAPDGTKIEKHMTKQAGSW